MIPVQVIALFVKTPLPGRVKTRLARDIGTEAACIIYRRLANRTIEHAAASGIPLVICYDGNREDVPDDWQQPAWSVIPQATGDLGRRMAAAFRALFHDAAHHVVVIGSDIPGIDCAYLRHAFSLLDDHDMVIGPATDGGYCLIGFRRQSFTPRLFQGVPWSTGQVLRLTLQAAAREGLNVGLLPPLSDIDTIDDLRRYADERENDSWKE